MISLVKPQEVKTTKIDYQTVTILDNTAQHFVLAVGSTPQNSFDFYERHTIKSEQKMELNDDGYQNAG